MRARIAGYAQPAAAAGGVVPQLIVRAGRVVAQVDCLDEVRLGIRRAGVRALEIRISQIGELAYVALTAERAWNTHRQLRQCRLG